MNQQDMFYGIKYQISDSLESIAGRIHLSEKDAARPAAAKDNKHHPAKSRHFYSQQSFKHFTT